MKHTKIVCTIGPASSSETVLKKMLGAGMNAVRINSAHGSFEEYAQIVKQVRRLSGIPIILDIKGPELRLRLKREIFVKEGGHLEVGFSSQRDAFFSSNCWADIRTGDQVLISDGSLQASVIEKKKSTVVLEFANSLLIKDKRNVAIAGRRLNIPPLSENDYKAISFACQHGIDFIALSFTRDARDVLRVRRLLKGKKIGIIAKIENGEGIQNIDQILDCCEGVMIARGDLGVELPLQKIPMIQKKLIQKCNQRGILVITATQMLDSMIQNPRPTRAEASDVANSILDGSDAVMLSGETTSGSFPVQAVEVIASIARETEPFVPPPVGLNHFSSVSDALSRAVFELCKTIRVDKIVCITQSGRTAQFMARFHANIPIIAVTSDPVVKRQLQLYYAVLPVLAKIPEKNPVFFVGNHCLQKKLLEKDDLVVFLRKSESLQIPYSNALEVYKMSELVSSTKKQTPLVRALKKATEIEPFSGLENRLPKTGTKKDLR